MSAVVAKSVLFKQTVLAGLVIPFQSIVGGHYRLSVTLSVSANAGASGTIYPAATWTDTYGAQSLATVLQPARVGVPYASGGIVSWSSVVYVSPVTLGGAQVLLGADRTLSDPVPSGSQYDLHCLIEELSAPLIVTQG